MFYVIKDVNYLLLAIARIFGRLGAPVSKYVAQRHMKDTDQEENADPREDCICRWECLKVTVRERFSTRKRPDIHQPNALANGPGK